MTLAVTRYEFARIRIAGPDLITAFVLLFVIQCCLPGVVIYLCLPWVEVSSATGVIAFDRIFTALDLPAAYLVLGLTACFIVMFYASLGLWQRLLGQLGGKLSGRSLIAVHGSAYGLMLILSGGFLLSIVSFYTLGDSIVERFANLIFYRAGSERVQGTLLNAFAFALTQSWAWLSLPALFVVYERWGRRWSLGVCLLFLAVFVLLGVSRRAVFIPIFLTYVIFLLYDGRWRLKWVVVTLAPLLLWIAFGKELIGSVAFGVSESAITGRYESFADSFLRAASDIGITVVESLGAINLLDLAPRFGVDHLLSVLRQIPTSHSWLGQLPPRIVRLSTEAFSSAQDEDIPPGLFGQMWMDFRAFGPVVWGLLLSLQISIAQHVFAQTIRTRQAAALFAVLTFVIALPLNTGSYDFTFSIDIYVLCLAVLLTFRLIPVRIPTAPRAHGPTTAPHPT
ncbi:MAG: hypothetical protein JOZ03_03925 [Gammaproteobacteria bacterium]|nr:hypothetical protein [Gammaproteobacteria bacterium]